MKNNAVIINIAYNNSHFVTSWGKILLFRVIYKRIVYREQRKYRLELVCGDTVGIQTTEGEDHVPRVGYCGAVAGLSTLLSYSRHCAHVTTDEVILTSARISMHTGDHFDCAL